MSVSLHHIMQQFLNSKNVQFCLIMAMAILMKMKVFTIQFHSPVIFHKYQLTFLN